MRLLAGSLLTAVAIFGLGQAFGQQGGQNIGGQSGQGIKGQPQGGLPGQSPIGPTGQSIKGQPAQQGGQNPIGQPGQNSVGQPGQPLNGQPGQTPVGQPGQPLNGQPALNPTGSNVQPAQSTVGQLGQVPTGLTVQGRPNQVGQAIGGNQNQSGVPLYEYADVRRSLNLTDQQIKRLNTAYDQVRQHYRSQMGRVNSLPEAQRAGELQRLQKNQQNEFISSMKGVFTPQQIQRYRQLEYQSQGARPSPIRRFRKDCTYPTCKLGVFKIFKKKALAICEVLGRTSAKPVQKLPPATSHISKSSTNERVFC